MTNEEFATSYLNKKLVRKQINFGFLDDNIIFPILYTEINKMMQQLEIFIFWDYEENTII